MPSHYLPPSVNSHAAPFMSPMSTIIPITSASRPSTPSTHLLQQHEHQTNLRMDPQLTTQMSQSPEQSISKTSTFWNSTRPLLEFGWWWEVSAISLSIISMALILAILFTMHGKPLTAWHLPIQINSLVAVFSTFAKSALLVALAEGVSQLKWNHFERCGGTLDQLETFDQASRGPWGALLFPFKIFRGRSAILAAMGALLTVLALGFEPFTQQIIEFPSRPTVLSNETAYAVLATDFTMPKTNETYLAKKPQFSFFRSFFMDLPDVTAAQKSRFVCPGGDCQIPEHWSLATCQKCEDDKFFDDVDMNCTYHYGNLVDRGHTLGEFKSLANMYNGANYSESWALCTVPRGKRDDEFNIYVGRTQFARFLTEVPFEFWNASQNAYVDKNFVALGQYTTDTILWVDEASGSATLPSFYEDLDAYSGFTMTTQRCRYSFCAKKTEAVEISQGKFALNEATVPFDTSESACSSTDCLNNGVKPSGFAGPLFKIDTFSRREIADLAEELLVSALGNTYLQNATTTDTLAGFNSSMNSFLLGDHNLNATQISGVTIGKETYVHVQWVWAVFPCIIVLGSVVFLLLTILVSSRGEQLFKTSMLTGYFHSLEGWTQAELQQNDGVSPTPIKRRDTHGELGSKAHDIKVKLRRNETGKLEFTRQF